MLQRAVRLRDLAGIRLDVDPWLAPALVAAVWFLARSLMPRLGAIAAVLVALAVVLGLVASVLAHELAHALEARRRGLTVRGITLLVLGGATALDDEERDPSTDLAIAAVGPWTSLTLAATFGLITTVVDVTLPAPLARPVGIATGTLGWANLVLAVTNVVPAAPLDGGRVLSALLWRWSGDRARSIRIVSAIGLALGIGSLVLGFRLAVVDGRAAAGSVLGLLGLFLIGAARLEARRVPTA